MNALTVIAIIIAVIALAGVAFLLLERNKTRAIRSRFGPEYDRAVDQEGSPRRAVAVLEKRQKRVASYNIRPLTPEERDRLAGEWRMVQERFVDDPQGAVAEADRLIGQAMRTRGYPTSDFERQAADLSVEHPHVVANYRAAHDIAVRSERGQATTEHMRLAMQHYRSLFEELAEVGSDREEVHR